MILRSLSRRRLAFVGLVAIAGAVFATQAQARTEQLRWTHSRPGEVQDFLVHIRNPDGSDSQIRSLNVPTPDDSGIYGLPLEVGDGDKLVSLRAIGPGGIESQWTYPQLRTDPASVVRNRDGAGDEAGPTDDAENNAGNNAGNNAENNTRNNAANNAGNNAANVSPVGAGLSLTPTTGAALRYDFESNTPGSVVTDWRETGGDYSLRQDNSQFGVVALGDNNVLRSNKGDADSHAHAFGSTDSWSNYEVRGRMAVDSADAGIGVTAYSQFSSSDDYYRLGRKPNGSFMLEGRPAISCTSATTNLTPVPGEWYRYKLYIQDIGGVNRISAKVWNERSAEPDAPQALCQDTLNGRLTGGRIGAWSGGGEGKRYWDDFEVILSAGGGGADLLPPPVLIQIVPVQPERRGP